jgi:UDP-glucose 4-epimerase
MSRILLTGATSFIGRALCRVLLTQGHNVVALSRPGSLNREYLPKAKSLEVVDFSISNISEMASKVKNIDITIHLAWDGIGSAGRDDFSIQQRNLANSIELIRVVSDLGCQLFIGAGSQAEYGFVDGIITEETPCAPVIEYGKAKLDFAIKGGVLCDQLGIRWRMLRIFSVYGPGDHPWTLIMTLIRNLQSGAPMNLTECSHYWNYLFVEDAARAFSALLGHGCPNGIYNIAEERSLPLREYVSTVCSFFPNQTRLFFGAIPYENKRILNLRPSVDKIIRETGWRPEISFFQGIERTIQSVV